MPNLLPGSPETPEIAKAQARRLASALKDDLPLKHGQALELIARIHGQQSWGHLRAEIEGPAAPAVPENINAPDLSAEENTRIVFEGMTACEVQHLAKLHLNWSGYESYELQCVLKKLDVAYSDFFESNPDLRFFPKVTLGDLRQAEHAYHLDHPERIDNRQWISSVLDRIFNSDISPRHIESNIHDNMQLVLDPFLDYTRHKLEGIPVDITTKGIHAVCTSPDVEKLHGLLPGSVNLTIRSIRQQQTVSRFLDVPCPNGNFRNPAMSLKLMLSMYAEKGILSEIWKKTGKRIPAIVKLTDLLMMPNPDILLAQARSCGIFMVVWANRMDLESRDILPIFRQTNLLIENCSQTREIVVCSNALQEARELQSVRSRLDRTLNTILKRQ